MQKFPMWKLDPEPVLILCQVIKEGSKREELIVQFKINGDVYTAFVPEQFVNREKSGLKAFIVADFGDSWLIDIPTETLTSGPRVRVPDDEKASVVLNLA